MRCNDAQRLVPSHLDGELSEAQAGLLRRHLMDCPSCRTVVRDARALSEWFEPAPAAAVPPGFAARVARRAFAGDTGEHEPAPAGARPAGELLPFVLRLSALAAGLLLALALALRTSELPAGGSLMADELPALDKVVERLDELNRDEAPVDPPRPADERAHPAPTDR